MKTDKSPVRVRFAVPALGRVVSGPAWESLLLGSGDTARRRREGDAPVTGPRGESVRPMLALSRMPCNAAWWQDGELQVVTMPDGDDVRQFVEYFALPDFEDFADRAPEYPWYEAFSKHDHDLPLNWMQEPEDARPLTHRAAWKRSIVDLSCRILGGAVASYAAKHIQFSTSRGDAWRPYAFRDVLVRLFDRLHIEHAILDEGDIVRVGSWWNVDARLDPLVTVIGEKHPDNPYWKLRQLLATQGGVGGTLGSLAGLTDPPDCIALPMDERQSGTSSLIDGIDSELPANLRTALLDIADVLERAIDGVSDVQTSIPLPLLNLVSNLLVTWVAAETSEALERVPGWIRDAAEPGLPLRNVAERLVVALDSVDFQGLLGLFRKLGLDDLERLTGLDGEDLAAIEDALVNGGRYPQAILLGDWLDRYAADFASGAQGALESVSIDPHTWVTPDEQLLATAWARWWEAARPTADAAVAFDVAGRLAEQLVFLDDEVQAVNLLAIGEGLMGSALRGMLADAGLWRIADGLGGISPAAIIRFAIRQMLTDNFLAQFATTANQACLHTIFCWMNTGTKRANITLALGPTVSLGVFDAETRTNLEKFMGWLAPMDQLVVRAAFLPDQPVRGALGVILGELADVQLTRANLEGINATIPTCDLYAVRAWLRDAREACLASLEPDFTQAPHGDGNWGYPEGFPIDPELILDNVDILPGRDGNDDGDGPDFAP